MESVFLANLLFITGKVTVPLVNEAIRVVIEFSDIRQVNVQPFRPE